MARHNHLYSGTLAHMPAASPLSHFAASVHEQAVPLAAPWRGLQTFRLVLVVADEEGGCMVGSREWGRGVVGCCRQALQSGQGCARPLTTCEPCNVVAGAGVREHTARQPL